MARKQKLSDEIHEKVVKSYLEGKTYKTIAKELDICYYSVHKCLVRKEVELDRQKPLLSENDINFIKNNYTDLGPKKCSKVFNVGIHVVKRLAKKLKLRYKPYQCRNGYKICRCCKEEKEISKFQKDYSKKDSLYKYCSVCTTKKARKSRSIKANRDKINKRTKDREAKDPNFKLLRRLRSRLYKALKNICGIKSDRTINLLGCEINFLWNYLEKLFKKGMTVQNYGTLWQIDHIIPCTSFDLTKPEEQRKCFHYSNLQPLWTTTEIARQNEDFSSIGNINKGNRILNQEIMDSPESLSNNNSLEHL